ncbi:MAG: hypothetical protein E7655_01140 [Ruminococcaceae bacterium]|nr:hypothetical protein [Oscillospiraceae bacterium]
MKCPYCRKDMELGYIQCRDGVTWTPKKQLVAALSCFGRGGVSLANGAAHNADAVYAYRCGDCQKVVIDYAPASKKEEASE